MKNEENKTLVILTNIPTPYRVSFFNHLYQDLKKNEINFFVLFCAKTEPNRHWKISPDEFHFPYKIMSGLHVSFKGIYPHFNPSVISYLQKQKPTWLLIGGAWNTPTMLIAAQKIWYPRTKRLFWSEGHADAVIHKKGLIPKIKRKIMSSFDAFVVPNQKSETYLKSDLNLNRPFLRLPNTIDENYFSTTKEQNRQIRILSGIPINKRVFLQVSQLEEKKGVIELVASFLELTPEYQEKSILVIIGEGSLRGFLEKKIKDKNANNIILTGHLDKEEVKRWLQIADIFVLATKFDPNPLSPLEASFMKLPVLISSKAGNYNEILIPGYNGRSINEITPCIIKGVIEEMITLDHSELQKMGERSYENASLNFVQSDVIRHFISQLKKIL